MQGGHDTYYDGTIWKSVQLVYIRTNTRIVKWSGRPVYCWVYPAHWNWEYRNETTAILWPHLFRSTHSLILLPLGTSDKFPFWQLFLAKPAKLLFSSTYYINIRTSQLHKVHTNVKFFLLFLHFPSMMHLTFNFLVCIGHRHTISYMHSRSFILISLYTIIHHVYYLVRWGYGQYSRNKWDVTLIKMKFNQHIFFLQCNINTYKCSVDTLRKTEKPLHSTKCSWQRQIWSKFDLEKVLMSLFHS